ncbi:hypothetical protein M0E87_04635 [Corynebacterium sp. CCM 9185]|uniref:Uncharacterized protein n=1 Tax=Corynebacterium marambiense TaxID=2765364 RepID=A0ABS0VZE2_9CORY|nr:hypothetical protein [Corynebacterium marambiense]MBI9000783.1 hypothetical protein [Corynebacterium marambiense]MCK7662951.1 hypothetical protein [Corynebacterium marambiense]
MSGSTNPIADLNDSLLGWASQTELKLAQVLADRDRVTGTGLKCDDIECIERFYGTFLSRQMAAGATLDALMDVTPTVAVVTLVSRAARMTDQTNFFVEYLHGLGLAPTNGLDEELSGVTIDLVRRVGLVVPEKLDDPVLLLAAHAGITGNEVPGLLELLDVLQDAGHELTGAGIVDMLADGSYVGFLPAEDEESDGELLPVTVGVAAAAPEMLTDVITRVIDLRELTRTDPLGWRALDTGRDTQNNGSLPVLLRGTLAAELRERPVGTENRGSAVGVATREHTPRIIFDAARGKVCLRLPEQALPEGQDAEVQWRVSVDGTTRIYRTGRSWGETGGYSELLDLHVERQLRELTVADITNETTWVVPVVDSEDPVLVFSVKGQNLTELASLHHPELIVVTPDDSRLVDVVTGDDIPVISSGTVDGWAGWTARRVDTSQAASLQVLRPGQTPSPMHNVRCVDPRQRVMFRDPAAPVADLRSLGGLPIHSASLLAEFPPTVSGAEETWWLSISAYAGTGHAGDEVAPAEPLIIPAEGGVFDIFDPELYDAPWVGEYLVRLRGPRNESFRHEYAIVEGLNASTDIHGACRSVRIPAAGGLSEASCTVRAGAKPFTAQPRTIHVDPEEAGGGTVITTDEGDAMPLRFTPPRLTFEVPLTTQPPMWRTTRLICGARQFDADGTLRIRATGELGDPKVTVRNHHGAPLRTVRLTAEDGRTYTAPMTQLAASTAVLPGGRMEFEWTDPRSDRRVSVNLALIDSTPHATGVTVEDGHLVFEGLARDRNLAAWVWPAAAPWVFGRTIPVTGQRTELPADLVDAGDLTVQLHSADPFSVLRAPIVPGSTAFTVAQSGHYTGSSEPLNELSAFLSGDSDTAPTDTSVMPVLWDFLAGFTPEVTAPTDPENEAANAAIQLRRAVSTALAANPAAALAGLSASLVPSEAQPGKVVVSGLVHGPFAAPAADADDGTDADAADADAADAQDTDVAIHRTAWIGTLELLAQLPAVHTAVEEGEPRARLRALLDRLAEVAGKRLVETLSTGRDATLDTACIDQSTVQIAQMDEAQQESLLKMFFAQAEIVPGPIMDDSARLLAVFETFNKRHELNALLADREMVTSAAALMKAMRGANRRLYSSARVRFDKLEGVDTDSGANTWALAPVVSLVFALAARMHAHGLMGKSKLLTAATPGWSRLADLTPDLVTGDLIAAEAMVLAVTNPGIGD